MTCRRIEALCAESLSPDVGHRSLEDGQVLDTKLGDAGGVVATETYKILYDDHVQGVQVGHYEVDGSHEACGVTTEHDIVNQLTVGVSE